MNFRDIACIPFNSMGISLSVHWHSPTICFLTETRKHICYIFSSCSGLRGGAGQPARNPEGLASFNLPLCVFVCLSIFLSTFLCFWNPWRLLSWLLSFCVHVLYIGTQPCNHLVMWMILNHTKSLMELYTKTEFLTWLNVCRSDYN